MPLNDLSSLAEGTPRDRAWSFWTAVVCGVALFCACLAIMGNGHLHEDAYILFQYSRNLANGHGIVFDATSGRAEGATDFLWMATLAGVHWASRRRIDIGVAAALINALGMFALVWSALSLRRRFDAFGVLVACVLLVSGGAAAAMGGFSTLAFGGLYALLVVCCLRGRLWSAMLLATALSLFRPDGFVLAVGTLAAWALLARPDERWPIVRRALPAFVIPLVAYFVWRYWYFGMPLPLPLLVKQKADSLLAGLEPNFGALRAYIPLIVCLFVFRKSLDRRLVAIVAGGSTALFALLLFAHQSQNIGYRFQFPIVAMVVLVCAATVPRLQGRASLVCLLPLVSVVLLLAPFSTNAKYLTNSDYINSFPSILKERIKLRSIAVTEAGRFPFWYDAPTMVDLVGLNSKAVVLRGPARALEETAPDLIFVHHAGRYTFDGTIPNDEFFAIDPASVRLTPYSGRNPIQIAPEAALRYAVEHGYQGVAVKYGGGFNHVYFLEPSVDLKAFDQALRESFHARTNYFSIQAPSK